MIFAVISVHVKLRPSSSSKLHDYRPLLQVATLYRFNDYGGTASRAGNSFEFEIELEEIQR